MQNNYRFLRLKPQIPMSTHLRRKLETPNKNPGAHKMIVVGGTGCVGERVCKHATTRGHNVWSLSKNFPYSFPHTWTKWYHPIGDDEEKPWPLFMTWRRFNILQPFATSNFMDALSGANTMVHCVGQQRPAIMGLSKYANVDKDDEHHAVHEALKRLRSHRVAPTPEKEFEDTNLRSVKCSLEMAKHLNVKNFIFISASGSFPTWPWIFGDNFLDCKQKAEEILGGVHFCHDGTPMNIAILRPRFIYSERKPVTSAIALLHSSMFPNSPVASKLTADRVARCVVHLSTEFKDVAPKKSSGAIWRWGTPARWILEDDDIFNYVADRDEADKEE